MSPKKEFREHARLMDATLLHALVKEGVFTKEQARKLWQRSTESTFLTDKETSEMEYLWTETEEESK